MTTIETEIAEAPATISVALEALWLISQLGPQRTSYNEAVSIRKQGPLQLDALREAFNTLVRRYDVWHSVIDRVDGEPALLEQPPVRFALEVVDLSGLTAEAAERQAVRIVADAARVPYDLSRGPLLRPTLVRLGADEHRLYLAMHHAIFDGVSLARTVLPELVDLYDDLCTGGGAAAPAPRVGYADFARWERQWIETERAGRRLEYWRGRLTPAPARLSLPLDTPRPAPARYRGCVLPVSVPPQTADALRAMARACGGTEFQAFGAVWATLLHHVSGDSDIVFGTPTDVRRRREFEPVVGYCLTPLVLRVDLSDDPGFAELMTRVRNELLDGLDHLVPFERIVRDLNWSEPDGANPVYQTMFTLEPTMAPHDPAWSLHQLDTALADAIGASKLDLELQLDPRPDGSFTGQLNYDPDLFSADTAERLIAAWQRLLEAVAASPSQRVSELGRADTADAVRLSEFNATATSREPATLPRRFAEVAARQPAAPAVTAGGLTVSYGELQRAARAGEDELRAAGVADGDVVGVCLEPSVPLVAAALATLSVGAALLLLDPAAPAETLAARSAAAGCAVVIVPEGADAAVAAIPTPTLTWRGGGDDPDADSATATPAPENPSQACMLVPERDRPTVGAALSHATVGTLVTALITGLGLGSGDTVLSLPAMLYESPCTELWPALLAGARLVLAPADVAGDGAQLSRLIRAEKISFLHATPRRWEALIDTGMRAARGLGALSGGEPLSRELADRLLERCRVLWSAYTPAVAGGYCALGRVAPIGPVTVGRPIANHRAHVVNGRGEPRPIGCVGELLVAGPLATSANLEAGALVSEPEGEGRALRTGQRARWRADGRLALVA